MQNKIILAQSVAGLVLTWFFVTPIFAAMEAYSTVNPLQLTVQLFIALVLLLYIFLVPFVGVAKIFIDSRLKFNRVMFMILPWLFVGLVLLFMAADMAGVFATV